MYVIKFFESGFEYLEINNKKVQAKIALQGAHIFEFKIENDALLWLSDESKFEQGVAIRGGIPICWPRFGNRDRSLPQHGFARTSLFDLIEVKEINEDTTKVHLQLKSDKQSRKIWDCEFILDIVLTLGDSLGIIMTTTNRDTKEFLITQAFHTYFQLQNIEETVIEGLEGIKFLDTLHDKESSENEVLKITAETDRIYSGVKEDIFLKTAKRTVVIHTENSNSAIVWNPWLEKCSKMSAIRPEAYKEFVCIESANALNDFRVLKPNDVDSLSVTYHLQRG